MTKIAIVGSREFKNKEFVKTKIRDFLCPNEDTLISGGARGVDSWAEEVADERKCNKRIFKPEWDKYGKSAGFIRNKLIIDSANYVVAFWDGQSKGTKHSIDLAIKQGKPVDIYIRK